MAIKKNNFSQAIKKLWNENNEDNAQNLNKYLTPEEDVPNQAMQGGEVPHRENVEEVSAPYYKPASQTTTPIIEEERSEITFISNGTYVDGSIRSTTGMNIAGDVKGNVETTKDITMSGTVIGDIKCSDLVLNGASMQGNIKTKGLMSVNRESVVIGNISSNDVDINGKLKGNLSISGKVALKEDAVVFGDINAATIAIDEGAVVQGYIDTTYLTDNDNDRIFPEQIVIS